MKTSLLYFPYINIPNSEWTIRTLLYYENICSIVPYDFFYEPDKYYEPFTLKLVRQQLLIPINPMENLENHEHLNKCFLDFVNSVEYDINVKRKKFQRSFHLGDFIEHQEYGTNPSKVSGQKFTDDLMYSLVNLGLAKKSNGNWYYMEKITANYLMAYWATVLASKLDMIPATDKIFSQLFREQFRKSEKDIDAKRDRILQGILPLPKEIDLEKVQKFKEKNIDALRRFRNVVEQIALNPLYNNENLLDEKIIEMNFEKEYLIAKMNESNIGSILFGTACGVFGAFQGLSTASTTTGILLGLPGFASAIYSALKSEKDKLSFDQQGLKYLSLADNEIRFNNLL